jgi:hypothetical protein
MKSTVPVSHVVQNCNKRATLWPRLAPLTIHSALLLEPRRQAVYW